MNEKLQRIIDTIIGEIDAYGCSILYEEDLWIKVESSHCSGYSLVVSDGSTRFNGNVLVSEVGLSFDNLIIAIKRTLCIMG